MAFIKMTKESILLALRVHEDNRLGDLQSFQKQLMPVVVHNIKLMSSPWATDCLRSLKIKCKITLNGCFPSAECWKLDKDLDEFYFEHHW
jgi:hypothetical protein